MSSRLSVPRPGHSLRLLEGSAEFFPALVAAIDAASRQVRMETYIFDVTGSYALGLWITAFTAVCAPALLWLAAPRRPNPPPGSR